MKKIEGNNFIVNHSSLVIDGGNIVIGEIGLPNSYTTQSFIVMTDKVMRENEGLSQKEIETQIQDSFKPKECNSDYDDITIVWLSIGCRTAALLNITQITVSNIQMLGCIA